MDRSTFRPESSGLARESRIPQGMELAVWSGLMLTAIVLISRRATGGFQPPGSPLFGCLLATFLAVLGIVAFCRQAPWRTQSQPIANSGLAAASRTAALLSPPLFVGLAVLPVNSVFGMAYVLGLTLLQAAWLMMLEGMHFPAGDSRQADLKSNRMPVLSTGNQPDQHSVRPEPKPAVTLADEMPAEVERPLQSVTRFALPHGGEGIQGEMTATFEPGQKVLQLHVPFWPVLARIPSVECEASVEDGEVRAKVAAVHTFGMRIELRRSAAASQLQHCWVEFSAEMAPDELSDAA